jgi:hypothetical protein
VIGFRVRGSKVSGKSESFLLTLVPVKGYIVKDEYDLRILPQHNLDGT